MYNWGRPTLPFDSVCSHLRCVYIWHHKIVAENYQVKKRFIINYFAFVTAHPTCQIPFSPTRLHFYRRTCGILLWCLAGTSLGDLHAGTRVSLMLTDTNYTAPAAMLGHSCATSLWLVHLFSSSTLLTREYSLHALEEHRSSWLWGPDSFELSQPPFGYNLPLFESLQT